MRYCAKRPSCPLADSRPEAEALVADYTAWHTAYEATLAPHVPAVTAVKNAALKNSKKVLREFKIRYLLLPPVTEADWRAMGMGIRKEGHRIDPPKTKPEISFDTSVIREVGIHYQGDGAARREKPEHVHAIFLRWDFRDDPPANIKDLKEVKTDTESPAEIEFIESGPMLRIGLRSFALQNSTDMGGWRVANRAGRRTRPLERYRDVYCALSPCGTLSRGWRLFSNRSGRQGAAGWGGVLP
jgi:hypothetical protein